MVVEVLEYLQEKEMVNDFKFFRGIERYIIGIDPVAIDAEDELRRYLSQEISNEIDRDIVTQLTRRINGGNDGNYLNHWINMGNRA